MALVPNATGKFHKWLWRLTLCGQPPRPTPHSIWIDSTAAGGDDYTRLLGRNEAEGKVVLQLAAAAGGGEVNLLGRCSTVLTVRVAHPGHRDVEFLNDVCGINPYSVLELYCASGMRVLD